MSPDSEGSEYPARVAAAIEPWLKERITLEAQKRRVTESTFLREVLHSYFAFSALRAGNRVNEDSEGKTQL